MPEHRRSCCFLLFITTVYFSLIIMYGSSFVVPLLPFKFANPPSVLLRRALAQIKDGVQLHPNNVDVPADKIEFIYSRSSGPGGQNVNKVNSKAELRLHLGSAEWLDSNIRRRIRTLHSSKINKEDELIIVSQEQRAQARNKEICFDKLKEIISECCVEPKERELYEGLSEKGKQRRKLEKRRRGEVKESRRSGRGSFDD